MRRLLPFFLILIWNASCICLGDPAPDSIFSPVVDVEAPETGIVGETIDILVTHTMSNGCGKFSHHETSENGTVLTIRFYGYFSGTVCPDVILPIETTYSFKPAAAATYTLIFEGEGQTITRTIVVT